MENAVIVDAVRTPMGKRNGSLSGWHPADLAAEVLKALAERNNLDPELVEDVIMGCVMQVGAQALNLGRNAVLPAGWPETVPSTTVDRQCGSSQQSAHFAAQGVIAGAYDVVVAAGTEVMSLVPMGASAMVKDVGLPFGPRMGLPYADQGGFVPQGISAELIADKWDLSREDLDRFGLQSQERAARARDEGPITTTLALAKLIEGCLPRAKPGQSHPATRSFQALRIAVNDEYGELFQGLMAAERALKPGGKLAVVTFHSVEDRMVKRFLQLRGGGMANANRYAPATEVIPAAFTVTKRKAIGPDEQELAENPRSRSAKLRVATRTDVPAADIDPADLGMPMKKKGRR